MPARRLWLFRITALLLPVLALVLLELVLRLAGYGYDPAFFKEVREDGKAFAINNETFSLRFFPPELARWAGTFKFAAAKPADVRRIFIFGESAAMGDPQPSFGASRYLEILLREKFPVQKFEVINLGITAINSHVILPIARDVAARGQGDLWIIYMGNNEMVGPFGAATVFGSRAPPMFLVRLNLAVQTTRVGQLLVAGSRRVSGKSANTSWGGMQMFLRNQVPPADARRETVYRNFEGNLRDIVGAGLSAGAKVILGTVSVNLRDCPPFGSLANTNLPAARREQFQAFYAEALALQKGSNSTPAAQRFESAAKIDPQFAEAQFRWAQCLLRLTNAAAHEHFQLACDVDALPFRADTRINSAIKTLGRQRPGKIQLCDAEAELAKAADDGVAGDESFFEHVHFNFGGNYRLGLAWAKTVEQALGLPTDPDRNWPDPTTCEARLGLTDWNRLFVVQSVIRRMGQPPLSSQFNNPERLQELKALETRLIQQTTQSGAREKARAMLDDAIRRAPGDAYLAEGLANFLEAIGDPKGAADAYRRITELLPHDFYASLQLGRLLGEHGQPQEAERLLRRAAQIRPSLPEPWHELGVVIAGRQRYTEALECFERAIKLRPQDGTFLAYKAKALSRLGRRAEAIQIYREAVSTGRGGWEAHFELAGELAVAGDVNGAIREYVEVLKLNPRHAVSHVNLGVMLARMNRLDEAIERFEAAVQLDPNYKEARDCLAQTRARRAQKP